MYFDSRTKQNKKHTYLGYQNSLGAYDHTADKNLIDSEFKNRFYTKCTHFGLYHKNVIPIIRRHHITRFKEALYQKCHCVSD